MTDAKTAEVLDETLSLLEWRLCRLEFLLDGRLEGTSGQFNKAPEGTPTVGTRVRRLEQSLQQLARSSDVALDLLRLHSRLPELFIPDDEVHSTEEEQPTPQQKLSILLAEAPSLMTASSQLRQLSDLPIPPTSDFAKVIALQPRTQQLRQRQRMQAAEMSELRKRSATLVLGWHDVFVLGQGRCWADWDGRLKKVEREVRREEVRRTREG